MTDKAPFSIILYTGDFDRIHYALAMAATAAAMDRPVTLFITMAACRAFLSDSHNGWESLPLSSGVTGLPVTGAGMLDQHYIRQGIAGFETLLEAAIDLGIDFIVCEMGLRAMGLTEAEFIPGLSVTTGSLVNALKNSGQGNIITL
jgi:peroxiredoxin family protein